MLEVATYQDQQPQHHVGEMSTFMPSGDYSWLENESFTMSANSMQESPLRASKRIRLDNATKQKNQRYAANQRERKRMRSINKAFEILKKHVPIPSGSDESKLSKGDTLRFAIHYIRRLQEMIVQDNLARARSARHKQRAVTASEVVKNNNVMINDSGVQSQDGSASVSSPVTIISESFDEDTLSTEYFRREVKIVMRLPDEIERAMKDTGLDETVTGHLLGWKRKEKPAERTERKTVVASTWWPSMVLCCDGPNVTAPQFYCCRHFHQHVLKKHPASVSEYQTS